MRRSRGELPVPVRLGRTRNTGLLYLPLYLPLYRAPLLIAYRTVPTVAPSSPFEEGGPEHSSLHTCPRGVLARTSHPTVSHRSLTPVCSSFKKRGKTQGAV